MSWKLSGFADEGGSTVEKQIIALQTSGLKYIDIRSVDGFNIVDLPIDHARAVKSALDEAGITVQMFGSPIGKIDVVDNFDVDLARLEHLAELAPVLGCNAVRIFSYYNKGGKPYSEWQDISIARLKSLRDKAAALGLILYHENESHIFGDMPTDVAIIGKEVRDGKSFLTIFDFDNYTQGGQSAWDAWQLLKSDVDAIHLKDSLNRQHVPVGTGDGFVEKILRDAVASGWNGPISVEPHLSHSGAVAATGPSGKANQSYKDMTDTELFVLACKAATDLLKLVDAPYE